MPEGEASELVEGSISMGTDVHDEIKEGELLILLFILQFLNNQEFS